jgi:hypothetical protein
VAGGGRDGWRWQELVGSGRLAGGGRRWQAVAGVGRRGHEVA